MFGRIIRLADSRVNMDDRWVGRKFFGAKAPERYAPAKETAGT